jgi:hypothetical protein
MDRWPARPSPAGRTHWPFQTHAERHSPPGPPPNRSRSRPKLGPALPSGRQSMQWLRDGLRNLPGDNHPELALKMVVGRHPIRNSPNTRVKLEVVHRRTGCGGPRHGSASAFVALRCFRQHRRETSRISDAPQHFQQLRGRDARDRRMADPGNTSATRRAMLFAVARRPGVAVDREPLAGNGLERV